MRRSASSLQNHQRSTGSPSTVPGPTFMSRGIRSRNSSTAHSILPRWLLVLAASLVGFVLLGVWAYLPPSTVIGVQAQAQQQAQARSDPERNRDSGVAAGAAAGRASGVTKVVAAGSILVKKSKEQLQHQKQQRAEAAAALAATHSEGHRSGLGTGKDSFRGSSSTSAEMSAQQLAAAVAQRVAAPLVTASARVVVVGGGLAGLTAALQAAECLASSSSSNTVTTAGAAGCPAADCVHGAKGSGGGGDGDNSFEVDVLVVDKMPRLGGNSAKASSGMNALNPEAGDSEDLFTSDTTSSGGGTSRPELVHTLVHNSPGAVAFLAAHGVSVPGVTQLGGHTVARTRTVVGGANVGWTIMSALMAAVRANPRIRVLEGYSLKRIVTAGAQGGSSDVRVTGVELAPSQAAGAAESNGIHSGASSGVSAVSCGALVLATGGFAANRDMLLRVAPKAADLATTNGPWAQGDALQLAEAAGAVLVGLQDVQVHPTGFVDPADPGAGTKFLAPEKLRGVGGVLLDGSGRRFVDELATRDVVAAAVTALPGATAWLLLGRDAGAEYGSGALGFYCSKGLMDKAETHEAAAGMMGVSAEGLRSELEAYYKVAEAAGQAAQGGGREAIRDLHGKRVFPHPPHPVLQLPLYLARVTPVVHYTMGGVAINERAEALRQGGSTTGDVVRGLYAAGEVSGGLHGRNRLGGNSLLECVVFGRVAGAQAATCAP